MLQLPSALHPLEKFEWQGALYVADLQTREVLQIDPLIGKILDLCASASTDEILFQLQADYPESEILESLEALSDLALNGLLFSSESEAMPSPDLEADSHKRLKIFAPKQMRFGKDMTWQAIGAPIAHFDLLSAMAKHADVFITEGGDAPPGAHVVPFRPTEKADLVRVLEAEYDGILVWFASETIFLPLLDLLDIPLVLPIHEERGEDGGMINQILRWYASLREFDALAALSPSTKDFYTALGLDGSQFAVIPNGVNLAHFCPMAKQTAKHEVALMLSRPEIAEKKVVGLLSRFHPEKGASLYIQMAEMHPEYLFLLVVPELLSYEHRELPQNFIYAGKQPREKLPLFYNAFDVQCFPSLLAEACPGVVLEPMACGTPVIVPNCHGASHLVGDGGITVPAKPILRELGSFAAFISPFDLSDAIRQLLNNEQKLHELSQNARKRALTYSWDACAKNYLALFEKLAFKREWLKMRHHFHISFAPVANRLATSIPTQGEERRVKSILTNRTPAHEAPLQKFAYTQSVEEGLALSLLRRYRKVEVETVLRSVCGEQETRKIIDNVQAFLLATS